MSGVVGGLLPAGTAVAAVPSNDTSGGATVVPGLPFADTVDTTEATTDAEDAQANASNPACSNPFGPVLNNTVWYKFTAATDGALGVAANGSSYTVGVGIATGTPGALNVLSCGLNQTTAPTVAGTTYYVIAADLQATTGGTLQISFTEEGAPAFFSAPPPASATVGTPYTFTFEASGTPTPTFSVSEGTLPDGMTLSAAGGLAGTPSTPGASTFSVSASNSVGSASAGPFRISVNDPTARTFTARFPAEFEATYAATAAYFGVPPEDLAKRGLQLLAFLGAFSGNATETVPPPVNEGPFTVTTTWSDDEIAWVAFAENHFGLSGDEMHNAGAAFVMFCYLQLTM